MPREPRIALAPVCMHMCVCVMQFYIRARWTCKPGLATSVPSKERMEFILQVKNQRLHQMRCTDGSRASKCGSGASKH